MPDPLIHVRDVYKKFRRGEHFDSLRDLIAARLLGRAGSDELGRNDFWVLASQLRRRPRRGLRHHRPQRRRQEHDAQAARRNLRPTRGEIQTRGRVSALIELGAGFHGDLTGRENIHLNASILGMSRREIRGKFDAIVDFAGIEEFLDTPVKRYSSGMHARLGFAIAAHVDAPILLVDEVLSVGDRVFRVKCMEKMEEFLRAGVAVVFVSHDLGSVSRFCHRALVIERGREVFIGPAGEAVGHYHRACCEPFLMARRDDQSHVTVTGASLTDRDGAEVQSTTPGENVFFRFDVAFDIEMEHPSYGMSILRLSDHLLVFETSSTRLGIEAPAVGKGDRHRVEYEFTMNLPPGEYALGLHIRDRDSLEYACEEVYALRIMVEGAVCSGGTAYLDPRVWVSAQSNQPLAPNQVPEPVGR